MTQEDQAAKGKKGKGKRVSTAIRMLTLMRLVPRRSQGSRVRVGANELHRKLAERGFHVELRTVQRDLQELRQAFPGLDHDGKRDQLGWFWHEDTELLDIPTMDLPLALTFKLAEQYLQPVAPSLNESLEPYLKAASKVLEDEGREWLSRVAIVPRSMPLQPVELDGRVTRAVMSALVKRCRLRVRYRSRSSGVMEAELSPQGLVMRHEVSYLVATAWDYTDLRHYALHRMQAGSIELLEDVPAVEIEDFDLQDYIDRGEFQYHKSDQAVKLVLRVRSDVAHHLRETPLSGDQIMEETDRAGWHRLRATVPDTRQLRWWLLGLGQHVRVEEPADLRQELSDTLQAARALYDEA